MSTSRRVSWVASSTVGTGSPTPGRRYAARSIDPGLAGAHVGDPDRRHRRRRTACDDEADQARARCRRRRPPARRGRPGRRRGSAVTRDQPAVGLGAQPVERLVPLRVEGQARGVRRVGGPHVAVRRHRDLERSRPAGPRSARWGSAGSGRVRPTWTGMRDHRGRPRPRRRPAPAATSTTTAPGPAYPSGASTVSALRPSAPTPTPPAGEALDPVGGHDRHGATGGVDDVVGQAHPRRPAGVDLDHGVLA